MAHRGLLAQIIAMVLSLDRGLLSYRINWDADYFLIHKEQGTKKRINKKQKLFLNLLQICLVTWILLPIFLHGEITPSRQKKMNSFVLRSIFRNFAIKKRSIMEGYSVKEYGQAVKRYVQTMDLKDDPQLIAEYRRRHSKEMQGGSHQRWEVADDGTNVLSILKLSRSMVHYWLTSKKELFAQTIRSCTCF